MTTSARSSASSGQRAWWPVTANLTVTVAVVLVFVLALGACGGDDDQRATPTSATTTTTTSAATSSTSSTSSTSQPEPAVPRPDHWVGVTDEGRLVVVDTKRGDQVRTLGEFDHPEECPAPGEPAAGCQWVVEVAVSADGQDVYYETCCEPAPGVIHRVSIDGGEPEMVAFGAHPAVDAAGERLAVVELQWVTVHQLDGDGTVMFQDDEAPAILQGMSWSPDGERLAFVAFDRADQPGRVHVLDVDQADTLADATTVGPADPAGSWTLPTFRHDGALVVVEQDPGLPGSARRGPARALVVDPATGEVLQRFDRSDAVLSQHHDPSGAHLLYVLADGSVRWGLDEAERGVLADGGYLAAAW